MANSNAKKKSNTKSNDKKSVKTNTSNKGVKKEEVKKETKKINTKSELKKESINKEIKKESKKEEVIAKKVEEPTKKEKKSFSLTSKQKDIITILLVVVLLVVAAVLSTHKEPKLDIELPITLQGEAGFTEISYADYKNKVENNDMFLLIIVRDGCGYCEMYSPIVKEVADEYKLPIYYINLSNLSNEDIDELSSTNKYLKKNKWGTPTTLFMYGENIVDSISGYVEKEEFVEFVKENFKVEE